MDIQYINSTVSLYTAMCLFFLGSPWSYVIVMTSHVKEKVCQRKVPVKALTNRKVREKCMRKAIEE